MYAYAAFSRKVFVPYSSFYNPLWISFSEEIWLLQEFLKGYYIYVLFVFVKVRGEISKISAFSLGVSWKTYFVHL